MTLRVIERTRRVATLVVRPVDALAVARRRPVFQRGPVRPVRFRMAGRVQGGSVVPIGGGAPKPVQNLSGDTVFTDLRLAAGTYRIELDRERLERNLIYQDILASERDVAWDPAAPGGGIPGLPSHVSRLVEIHLHPEGGYPFPSGSTLIRGGLVWYDGGALTGALVREPSALLPQAGIGMLGDFVLVLPADTASGAATVELDTAAVDASSRPDGLAYLAAFPATWPVPWRRGTTSVLRQAGLTGVVQRGTGRRLEGAVVRLAGRPGSVRTDSAGRWIYRFQPRAPAGAVDLTVEHPDHPTVSLPNVAFPADATGTVPPIVMS